jgi:hypothetical protein
MKTLYKAKWWIVPAVLAAATPAFAQVYRCKQPDGRIAYQDTPCATGEQKKVASPASGSDPVQSAEAPPPADFKQKLNELDRRRNVREAIAAGTPMASMTRAELDAAMGRPDGVSSNQYGSSFQEQLVFNRGARSYSVLVKDGVVTSVQNYEKQQAPRKACPTEYDIKRIELDMSTLQNRENQPLQAQLRRQLADAKACK